MVMCQVELNELLNKTSTLQIEIQTIRPCSDQAHVRRRAEYGVIFIPVRSLGVSTMILYRLPVVEAKNKHTPSPRIHPRSTSLYNVIMQNKRRNRTTGIGNVGKLDTIAFPATLPAFIILSRPGPRFDSPGSQGLVKTRSTV